MYQVFYSPHPNLSTHPPQLTPSKNDLIHSWHEANFVPCFSLDGSMFRTKSATMPETNYNVIINKFMIDKHTKKYGRIQLTLFRNRNKQNKNFVQSYWL